MTTNLFEDGLKLFAEAEGRCSEELLPLAPTSGTDSVSRLLQLIVKKREHSQLHELAGKQRDHLVACNIVDARILQTTSSCLRDTAAVLQRVASERAVLAIRLKDLNSKQTVGIEPAFQKRFLSLLLEATTGAQALESTSKDLQWAAQSSEQPSSWEQHLHALTLAIEECNNYHVQLEARARAISQYTSMSWNA